MSEPLATSEQVSAPCRLGIVGGSGLYDLPGLSCARRAEVASPFGTPSEALTLGELSGRPLAFLPRHGSGHRLSPSDIDYRANIDVLKRSGVVDLLSVSAVGSLREDLPPGTFVIVDQFIDRTFAREKSFFGRGCVAHVGLAQPTCARLGDALEETLRALGLPHQRGGTYVVMEGPQFSTRAESELYRKWGADVIGMTNMPEAKLAREAEICYSTLAMVTDFDGWHPDHEAVTVDQVIATMSANVAHARRVLAEVATRLGARPASCPHGCDRALEHAVMTAPDARDPALVERLSAVAGRVLTPRARVASEPPAT